MSLSNCAMNNDAILRQEIRHSLNQVRSRIRSYTGLYSSENLPHEVLRICDETMVLIGHDPRLEEARRIVEHRCRRLAQVANRFADRDPVSIAAARAQAVAAVDVLQDTLFELRKASAPAQGLGAVLKRRSL